MKLHIHSCFLIFLIVFLLFISPYVSSRLLTAKKGHEEDVEIKGVKNGGLPLRTESHDSFDWLMGLEACENGDKECFNRRVLAEAHLDYIYTQKHKP